MYLSKIEVEKSGKTVSIFTPQRDQFQNRPPVQSPDIQRSSALCCPQSQVLQEDSLFPSQKCRLSITGYFISIRRIGPIAA